MCQSDILDPDTSIYYIRTDIGSSDTLFMFCPFKYVLNYPLVTSRLG